MAIQMKDTVRNARLDAIETVGGASCTLRIYSGDQPADVTQANLGTLLWSISLPADWMANATGGSKAKAGTWQGNASGTGTAGHFRLYNSQATMDGTTCIMQGDIVDDMTIDNASIVSGQQVTVTQFTLTDANP